MKKIGFIGTGVMGQSIIKNLMQAGYSVSVYTRTKAKAENLLAHGAIWAQTPQQLATESDIIFTMVGYPADVEDVYFRTDGIFAGVKENAIVIDMTTSEPSLAKKIAQEAIKYQATSLDAPVSGGDIGAQNGTLSIMVGGEKASFDEVLPIFQIMGENIVYQGEAGAGQHTKMCNQIAIASGMIGVCESLAYGLKAGLDMQMVLQSIASGAAGSWSLSNLAPRMLKDDYAPGFFIKHMVKDLGIALSEAKKMNLQLPGLAMANEMYEKLLAEGYGENGTQALIHLYE